MGHVSSKLAQWQIVNTKQCRWCGSTNLCTFTGEVAIHFPGLRNIDKPPVFVFPEFKVCRNCGIVHFVLPEAKLRSFAKNDAASG